VRLRRSWFGGVAALVLLPSSLLGGPETDLEPAGRPGAGQPAVEPAPAGSGEPREGARRGPQGPAEPQPGGPGRGGEPVPTPVPRAFAVRSPGTGRDDGMAG
ncbi:MAG TPA: hypothetical protein VFX88_19315, partial [Actinomycetota bacterium]|nr:hypothetical protein [Actinomycetota bacterium]